VDDDSNTRLTMQALLEAEGYEVACAADGQEALDYLNRVGLPALILLDLAMPVLDGYQFRERQLRNPQWTAVPVILISGDRDLARIAAALGVETYFRKPVEMGEMLDAVRVLAASTVAV
jgi:two-component system, chemotaxis family, chemotaxis protein CheY